MDARKRFRELLAAPEMTIVPGGFSPLHAVIAERAGFDLFFVAGSQVAAFVYGVPDIGVIGLRDMVDHARHVQARAGIPILVDADTGYGNAINVYFAVTEFVRSGVAGIQIEDQEAPKKSGTSAGRRCVSADEAVGKIRAAVAARNELDPDFVVVARCDSIGAEDEGFAEAVDRCVRYATEGGADVVWINSVESLDQLREVCARVPVPVMTIWGGPKPAPTFEQFSETGVKFVLYPVIAASAALQASWQILHDFAQRGQDALKDWGDQVTQAPWGKAELATLVGGGDRIAELERELLPSELQRNYGSTYGH